MNSISIYLLAILIGAFSRLLIGPWYHVTSPAAIEMVDGYPASYEAALFVSKYASFAGQTPDIFLTEIHLRAFIPIGLISFVASITGEAYWSTAIVETLGWLFAAKGTEILAGTLQVPRRTAFIAGMFVSSSPLFVSQMWMHVLHLAEISILPWAIAFSVLECRRILECAATGKNIGSYGKNVARIVAVLVVISHVYVYQTVIAVFIVIGVLAFPQNSSVKIRTRLFISFSVIATSLLVMTFVNSALLFGMRMAGIMLNLNDNVIGGNPVYFASLYGPAIDSVIRSGNIAEVLILRIASIAELVSGSFHHVVFVAGLLGLAYCGWPIRIAYAYFVSTGFLACIAYPAPWIAMTGFPLVYVGCASAVDRVARAIMASGTVVGLSHHGRLVYLGALFALVVLLSVLPNMDLFGDDRFMRAWWEIQSPKGPS